MQEINGRHWKASRTFGMAVTFLCLLLHISHREREEWGSGESVITLLNGVEGEVMETHYSSFYQPPVPTILLVILLHHSFLHICP